VFFPFTPLSTHFIFSENSNTNPRSLDSEYSYNRTMESKIGTQTEYKRVALSDFRVNRFAGKKRDCRDLEKNGEKMKERGPK